MLDELERMEKAATPGPWYSNRTEPAPYEICSGNPRTPDLLAAVVPEYGMNADLIVAARNALPALLAVARAAQALLGQVPSTIDDPELDEAREALEAALAALEGAEGRE